MTDAEFKEFLRRVRPPIWQSALFWFAAFVGAVFGTILWRLLGL